MAIWTTQRTVHAQPEDVLAALTELDAIRAWSPISFDLAGDDGQRLAPGSTTRAAARRLEPGSTARVVGQIAGVRVHFDVAIQDAGCEQLSLVASGPIGLEVDYEIAPGGDGTKVSACVRVRGSGGLRGRLVAGATEALLAAGALTHALDRIAKHAEEGARALAA